MARKPARRNAEELRIWNVVEEEEERRRKRRQTLDGYVHNILEAVGRERRMSDGDLCEVQGDFDGRVGVDNGKCRCSGDVCDRSQGERQRRGERSERVEREVTEALGNVKAKGCAL